MSRKNANLMGRYVWLIDLFANMGTDCLADQR